ncbi:vWA domain-containing protein [Scandinavium hiltneri]|nr:VWA domain-containing protein [Scandinavium hiltneri]
MFESVVHHLQHLEFQWLWLWVLLPLPLLLRYLPKPPTSHHYSVRVPNLPYLLVDAPTISRTTPGERRWMLLLWSLSWFCLVCAATRPQWIMPPASEEVSARDIVLVLDVSGSMATEDMQGSHGKLISRSVAMQNAVRQFIQDRKEDNIGLIVFGSKAYPFAPLSADHHVLLQRVNDLRPAMAGPQTSIGDAIGSTIKMYNSLASEGDESTDNERMVVLLTDGKDTASTLPPDVALRLARREHMIIHTIALAGGNQESINLPLLQKIARETGGTYHEVNGSEDSLQEVYQAINQLTPRKMKKTGWSYRQPLFMWPLGVALVGFGVMTFCLWSGRAKK